MEATEAIKKFTEFCETQKAIVLEAGRKGIPSIIFDFSDIMKFDVDLAEYILDEPEEALKAGEIAISGFIDNDKVIILRLKNISKSSKLNISDIRKEHLGKLHCIEGTIRQISDIRLKLVSIRYECPSCLPKGTKILTPNGYKSIEKTKVVISLDHNGKFIPIETTIINKGRMKVWRINGIKCSENHEWFIYKNGNIQVIQTKDLNIGDTFLRIHDRKLYNMWKKESKYIKTNMFRGMQKKELLKISNRERKNKNRQSNNDKIIQERILNNSNSKYINDKPQTNKKKINKIWNKNTFIDRTMQIKCLNKAWQKMWRKKILEIGKTQFNMEMSNLRKIERQKKRIISSPQRWQSLQQFNTEFNGSLSILPYKITSISQIPEEEIEMYDLQVPLYNNFILNKGIISHNCGNIITALQTEDKIKEPSRCGCGRKGNFRKLSKDSIDLQRMIIEESFENIKGNQQPKRFNVILTRDLVNFDKNVPGNKICTVGMIETKPIYLKGGSKSVEENLIFNTNSIELVDTEFEDIMLSKEDEDKIKELAEDKDFMQKMIDSIAPNIIGRDDIKRALLFQLAGGIRKEYESGETRGDIHTLIVADPGVGKTAMAKAVAKIAPKGRYIDATGASKAGLTASMVRDEFMGTWAVEAGALVLANKGFCVVDELDKMNDEDKKGLHVALSNQEVVINKANVHITMNAETTCLALANPKYGRFDLYSPLADQIDLPPALIDRFDLIFLLRDKYDEGVFKSMVNVKKGEVKPKIPIELIKKYIIYIRKNMKPTITDEAENIMNEFFNGMRKKIINGENNEEKVMKVPISNRQGETLIKLSEASAKLRLSNEVTKEDARNAIQLIKNFMGTFGYDHETGTYDIDMVSGTSSNSRRNEHFMDSIKDMLKKSELVPIEDVVTVGMDKFKMGGTEVEEFIEKLKRQGEFYEPKTGFLKML